MQKVLDLQICCGVVNDCILCLGTDPAQPSGSIIRISKHSVPSADIVAPPLDTCNSAIPTVTTPVSPANYHITSANEHVQDPTNELEDPTDQLEDLMDKQMEEQDLMDDDVVDLTDKEVQGVNYLTGAELPNSSKPRKFKGRIVENSTEVLCCFHSPFACHLLQVPY